MRYHMTGWCEIIQHNDNKDATIEILLGESLMRM